MERNTVKEYTIRTATEEESDSIITLLREVAEWLQHKEVNQWQYLLGGEATAEILECIRNKYTYIVMKEDEIVGTITASPKQNEWDEHIFGKEEVSDSVYIHRFAVRRKYKGNGIGESILQWVEENVQCDKEYLKLDCVGHNRTLNDFYKKNDFEYVGSTDGLSKFQKKRRK
ncbi:MULTISPECIES: GNAT family N-acetyltransferase [Bacillus cereus group]|uniref:GNAT family N-acetyltransferase n=1 Tax=Bacillus cereus group TaxID=86661 RepID=UPI0001A0C0C6|nr:MULTISPECIES: GNAT family N-acetyltransferase [Bacillus cereus group]EEL31315.1 Acetyltransferase [Bacillus cereus Rock3-28]MBJ7947473.1 GNAT family N-acetyltransferase [Bacillus cereus group sp. N24]UFH95681.1 GNAT family N-acetyltransferase [Bacillus toyonensis]